MLTLPSLSLHRWRERFKPGQILVNSKPARHDTPLRCALRALPVGARGVHQQRAGDWPLSVRCRHGDVLRYVRPPW
jgi:hypothetical protein